MKKVVCFFFVFLVTMACRDEDERPYFDLLQREGKKRMVVQYDDIPAITATLLNKIGLAQLDQGFNVNAGDQVNTLEIDWSYIKQIVEEDGREVYAFAINDNDENPYIFYNLIMRLSADKQAYDPYILRYTMADEFIPVYLETSSLAGFRGTVQKILLKGSLASTDRRGSAALIDPSFDSDAFSPCPDSNEVNDPDPGTGGGGGTDPDPTNPSITWECTTYVVTTTWYSQTCTVGGECEPPVVIGVDESLETECGYTTEGESIDGGSDCDLDTGETPILEPDDLAQSPCKLAKNIKNDPELMGKLAELKSKLSDNKEHGYALKSKDGGGYDYTYAVGAANDPEVSFGSLSGEFAGILHSQFSGTLSIFSARDIVAFYRLYNEGHMENHFKFIFGVVTEGGYYFLRIDSLTEFKLYGQESLSTEDDWDLFDARFHSVINLDNSIVENENRLASFLSTENLGLSLVKAELNDPGNWTSIKAGLNSSIKRKDCN